MTKKSYDDGFKEGYALAREDYKYINPRVWAIEQAIRVSATGEQSERIVQAATAFLGFISKKQSSPKKRR
jgi:hypothetical protein